MAVMEDSQSLGMANKSVVMVSALRRAEMIGTLCNRRTSLRAESFIQASGLDLGCLLISVEVVLEISVDPASESPISKSRVLWFRVLNQQNVAPCHHPMPQQW